MQKTERWCQSPGKGNGEKYRFGLGGWGLELYVVMWKLRCCGINKMEKKKTLPGVEYSQWVELLIAFYVLAALIFPKSTQR